MKKLSFMLVCLFAMMASGTGLSAQEVTVVLQPGWNWIGYPYSESADLETAFGDFEPMSGDVIASFWGLSDYIEGYGWLGEVDEMKPGRGYMYYSSRTATVSVVLHAPTSSSTVATAEPSDITATSAVLGGTVTLGEGNHIFARGVCWGTEPNPDIDGSHTADANVTGSLSDTLTELTSNTTYYVRAYVVTDYGLTYGNQQSFTTVVEYQYVDLGLPSGTLWATFNVGASSPEGYGDYFAWGETQPKDDFSWGNYQYSNGGNTDYPNLTKYCNIPGFGYNGFTDNLTILEPSDDAATANWGSDWRMPTKEEWWELYQNTTYTNTIQNGVNGRLFTASNGNSIFFPAADYPSGANGAGNYWTSSLCTDYPGSAWYNMFDSSNNTITGTYLRCSGFSVRPVRAGSQNTPFIIDATANPAEGGEISGAGTYQEGTECTLTATANEGYTFSNWTENDEVVSTEATYTFTVNANRTLVANFTSSGGGDDHEYVDLGLPSGTLWATCNVGAENPEDYGDHFAWGETQPKTIYNWSTYQYCNGSNNTFTKYCNNSSYGYNGFTDNLTTLEPSDDAAIANWGTEWRMPTVEEWQELYQNTTHTWTTQNGVNGRLFTAANGNSIFLPAAGAWDENGFNNADAWGYYWSNSLYTGYPPYACKFDFDENNYYPNGYYRSHGRTIRAVRSSIQNSAPTGAINGKFTINADGDQVYFSQGNLQYQASTNTWKFAENQYDYVGSTNSNISSTYSGWIDLFGWGTSGYNHGANCYQPWSTSQTNSDYYAYGNWQYNLYDQNGQADWGYNPISNGDNTANQWRTLTQPEWNYVFNTRTTTSGIRYAMANVNNVNGVILLPDDWNSSTYSLGNTNNAGGGFSSNTLTASQWSTLEQAGAVFLPAAGGRDGTSVYNVGSDGIYWSASCSNGNSARSVYFSDSYLYAGDYGNRYDGLSVRLVRVAE